MDNVEESLLSEQLGSSYVVDRPRIATVTFNTTQPAPVSSTTNAVALPHPSPHGRSVATFCFLSVSLPVLANKDVHIGVTTLTFQGQVMSSVVT